MISGHPVRTSTMTRSSPLPPPPRLPLLPLLPPPPPLPSASSTVVALNTKLSKLFPWHACVHQGIGHYGKRWTWDGERGGGPGAAAISRATRMSNSQEGRSRQTHPGGLGDENKLASKHWWPFRSLLGGLSENRREVARLWLRLLRQKRRLTSLISDENENEFDPFFSLSLSPPRLRLVSLP